MVAMASRDVIAVFIAESWFDDTHIRLWVKALPAGTVVLFNDAHVQGNLVLHRQLRCDGIQAVLFYTPCTPRSANELADARRRRDAEMARISTRVVDFGEIEGGPTRFEGLVTTVVQEREL